MSDKKESTSHDELLKIRRHFYEQHTPWELMEFFTGQRGPVDDAGKEVIAGLLFGEGTSIAEATRRINSSGFLDEIG